MAISGYLMAPIFNPECLEELTEIFYMLALSVPTLSSNIMEAVATL